MAGTGMKRGVCVEYLLQVLDPDKDEEESALVITSQDPTKREGEDEEMKDVEVSYLVTGLLVAHYRAVLILLLLNIQAYGRVSRMAADIPRYLIVASGDSIFKNCASGQGGPSLHICALVASPE